jgi:hypothetical protein
MSLNGKYVLQDMLAEIDAARMRLLEPDPEGFPDKQDVQINEMLTAIANTIKKEITAFQPPRD